MFLVCRYLMLMFLSPGTRLRSGQENLAFNELNIFHKVFSHGLHVDQANT